MISTQGLRPTPTAQWKVSADREVDPRVGVTRRRPTLSVQDHTRKDADDEPASPEHTVVRAAHGLHDAASPAVEEVKSFPGEPDSERLGQISVLLASRTHDADHRRLVPPLESLHKLTSAEPLARSRGASQRSRDRVS